MPTSTIREKVKKYIMEWNAQEVTASSGSGDTKTPTLTTEVPASDNSGALADGVAQDGVDN
jgi:hypothetical protein